VSACACGRPSWALVADLSLELQQLREIVLDEDVELLAVRLARIRTILDGTKHDTHGLPYHRALAREVLAS
jgi:hypothetical protein